MSAAQILAATRALQARGTGERAAARTAYFKPEKPKPARPAASRQARGKGRPKRAVSRQPARVAQPTPEEQALFGDFMAAEGGAPADPTPRAVGPTTGRTVAQLSPQEQALFGDFAAADVQQAPETAAAPPAGRPAARPTIATQAAAGAPTGINTGITPRDQLVQLGLAGQAHGTGPIGSALRATGSALMRPESAAAFGAEALAALIRGDTEEAGRAGRQALSTFTPGGPVTTWSETLRRHGVDLPTGVGPAVDIFGDPINAVTLGGLGSIAARKGAAGAGRRVAAEAGVEGDILEATAAAARRGEARPTFDLPAGSDRATEAAATRLERAQAVFDDAKLGYEEAVRKKATPKQVAAAERKRVKAEQRLAAERARIPGTPQQRRVFEESFAQPATGPEAARARLGAGAPTGRGMPATAGLRRRVKPGDLPYPIVAGTDEAEGTLERLTALVRSLAGKRQPDISEVRALQREISAMEQRIAGMPGRRGTMEPRVPGTPEANVIPGTGGGVPRLTGPDLMANVRRAEEPLPPARVAEETAPVPARLEQIGTNKTADIARMKAESKRQGLDDVQPHEVSVGESVWDAKTNKWREVREIKSDRFGNTNLAFKGRGAQGRTFAKGETVRVKRASPHMANMIGIRPAGSTGSKRGPLRPGGIPREELIPRAADEVVPGRGVVAGAPGGRAGLEMAGGRPARELGARVRQEPAQGLTPPQARAYQRMIRAAQRLQAISSRTVPATPRQLARIGQDFEASRAAFAGLMESTKAGIKEGVAAARAADLVPPPLPMPARRLTRAIERVEGGARGFEDVMGRAPKTPYTAGKAGKRLAKAETRLGKAQQGYKQALQHQRKLGPGGYNEAQSFTELAADAAEAAEIARLGAPIGFRVEFGFGRFKKGVNVPLIRGERARKLRVSGGETAGVVKQAFASRYAGRDHEPTAAVIQSGDQWKAGSLVNLKKELQQLARKHKVAGAKHAETRRNAAFVLDGTEGAISPQAQALADDFRKLFDRWANEATDAGVLDMLQLRDNYVPIRFIPEGMLGSDVVARSPQNITIGRRKFLLPGRTAMERARKLPTLKQAEEEFPGLIETDIFNLARERGEEQIRALGEAAMERTLLRRYGRVLKEGEEIPDGYLPAAGARFVPSGTIVREDAWRTLQELLEEEQVFRRGSVKSQAGRGMFSKLPSGRRMMSKWKQIKLMTPAYDIRNTKDDMMLALQSGLDPVRAAVQGLRTLKGSEKKVGGKAGAATTYGDVKWIAERTGVSGGGYIAGEVEKELLQRTGARRVIRMPRQIRLSREDSLRLGTFTRHLQKGKSPYEAAVRSRATHYDYADPGTVVEKWRRSLMGAPFGTWVAKNVPRQVQLAVTRPGFLASRQRVLSALEQESGEEGSILPEILAPWTQQEQPAQIPGVGHMSWRDPVSDINTLLPQGTRELNNEVIGNWLGQFAPGPTAAVEALSAMVGTPFSARRRRAVSAQATADPIEARLIDLLGPLGQRTRPGAVIGGEGEDVATRQVPRELHTLWQLVNPAFLGAAGRVMGSEEGARGQSLKQSALQALTGMNFQPFNSPQDAQYAKIRAGVEVEDAMKAAYRAAAAANAPGAGAEAEMYAERARQAYQQAGERYRALMDKIAAAGIEIG